MICPNCDHYCKPISEVTFRCGFCFKEYEQAELPLFIEMNSKVTRKISTLKGGEGDLRNLLVTEKNVRQVPIEWLCVRYSKIRKQLKVQTTPELVREIKIIVDYLDEINKSNLIEKHHFTETEQLEMDIPIALQKQYVPIVEYRLQEFYRMMQRKQWIECEIENSQTQSGRITASYGNISGVAVGGIGSRTEDAVVRHYERIERFQQELSQIEEAMYPLQKALQQLSYEQLQLVQAMYFVREKPKNDILIETFGWGRQKFFDIKKTALIVLAESLRIV
ncbi:hypothetical protein FHR92_003006 [Fontibacillus solani]|uniref:Uncharacterized protein n=1 Tax=Fontibacillus solani TaxID=1572857 RepID=A0A7W3SV42_9BACL|nr:hypothetical protein [Fontibacillus solani]MBA9086528.1 hypothetical protein [Fontibacillus solani]